MTYPSYQEIAEKLGYPRCNGTRPDGTACSFDHQKGSVGDGFVHWADRRRVERAGIRRFLKLIAIEIVSNGHPQGGPAGETRPWARLYLAQNLINNMARLIGVEMPARLTDEDRLAVKAQLVNVPSDEPLRKEAMTWAQKT
jgi:hypothetical protein